MPTGRGEYLGVSFPVEIYKPIQHLIDHRKLGYSSVAEFVKDAARKHLIYTLENLDKIELETNHTSIEKKAN